MIITSTLTLIGLLGTLAIVAYLRQVEDAIGEIQEQQEMPVCPVCHIAHPPAQNERMHTGKLRRFSNYYARRKMAAKSMESTVQTMQQRVSA
ncbi:hypothetical protein [Pontibacter virosus]|uniref:Uncharacterized protein n=1 Tax=Pontibacter virosus TaxID=1765052 RepID=A0A2U1B160_9BACT|nr:hypothetical protein [Pontibacter virosus]PVY42321.1 hypothetical protein C8E01_103187 [Pontibacter virosus]